MKLSAFRSSLVITLAIGFSSFVLAGSHGDQRSDRARSGAGLNPSASGPGFSSTNNPGVMGRAAQDEHPGFFNKDNNPGIQGSTFGRETSSQARMRETDSARRNVGSDFFNRNSAPDPRSFFGMRPDPIPARSPAVNPRPDPVPSATPSQGISPIPRAIPVLPNPLPSIPPHPSPSHGINPIPSATPSQGVSPVPSATPRVFPNVASFPRPFPAATQPPQSNGGFPPLPPGPSPRPSIPPANHGVSPIPSATPGGSHPVGHPPSPLPIPSPIPSATPRDS